MAMLSEVEAFLSLLGKAGTLVQHVAEGWYKASEDIADFPKQVQKLRYNQEAWSNRLERFGMKGHDGVKRAMDETQRLLDEQIVELDKVQRKKLRRLRTKLLFPTELTTQISTIISYLEEVENSLVVDERRNLLVGNSRLHQAARLPFTDEGKYVPLENTVKAVRQALENESNSRLVTLYGASGLGKSSMARHLALLYQDGLDSPVLKSGHDQTPIVLEQSWFKHGVFFLFCGPKAVSSALLRELWQKLGFQGLGLTEQSLPSSESGPRLKEQLTALLEDQNVLIILDDVRETTLVEDLFVDRKGIKYLITAHNPRVWPDGEQIPIERPSLEDSRTILAHHVKRFHGKVPEGLQAVVDEIIEECNHEPFDLANVAAKIGNDYAHELGEWESVARDLEDARDGDSNRPVTMFGSTYSRPLELYVSTFRPELLTILYTATICESQSWIPAIVFKIFFKRVHSSLASYWDCEKELTSSDLVKVHRQKVEWSNIQQETLSIHDKYRTFVDTYRKDQLETMVKKLFEKGSNTGDDMNTSDDGSYITICVLLILYGQKAWRDEAARRLKISIDDKDLALEVQPFVWLLQAGDQSGWQKQSKQHATEIILKYLRDGELSDHGMSELLSLKQTAADASGALYSMALSMNPDNSRSLLTGHHVETVNSLLRILRNDNSTYKRVTMDALRVLTYNYGFAIHAPNSEQSLVPLVLAPIAASDWFVTLLNPKDKEAISTAMQALAFNILGDLARRTVGDAILIDKLLPRVWVHLVNSISKDEDSSVQVSALYALARLYYHKAISERLVKNPDALQSVLGGLLALLGNDVDGDVQKWAVIALQKMTDDSSTMQVRVESFPGMVPALEQLAMLDESGNDDMHQWASWTLANLEVSSSSRSGTSTHQKIRRPRRPSQTVDVIAQPGSDDDYDERGMPLDLDVRGMPPDLKPALVYFEKGYNPFSGEDTHSQGNGQSKPKEIIPAYRGPRGRNKWAVSVLVPPGQLKRRQRPGQNNLPKQADNFQRQGDNFQRQGRQLWRKTWLQDFKVTLIVLAISIVVGILIIWL